MREIHPSLYLQDHLDAHKFFTTEAGLLLPKTIDIPCEEVEEMAV